MIPFRSPLNCQRNRNAHEFKLSQGHDTWRRECQNCGLIETEKIETPTTSIFTYATAQTCAWQILRWIP